MSKNGVLADKMLVILQEPDGKFGPIVRKRMFKAPNLYVVPSKSGKITKEILHNWYRDVLFPSLGPRSLMLIDSLNTYNDTSYWDTINPANKELNLLTIPELCTGINRFSNH